MTLEYLSPMELGLSFSSLILSGMQGGVGKEIRKYHNRGVMDQEHGIAVLKFKIEYNFETSLDI
jgi:hypothetical protein